MRIAFFTEAYDPYTNGVVVLVKSYKEALEAAGHTVVIFTPEHDDRPRRENDVIRMPSLTISRDLYPVALPFAKQLRHFDDFDFDIIHSHHPFSCGLVAEQLSKKYSIPLVYTFHTLLTQQSHYVPGPKNLAEKTLLKVIRRHCARAHCVTASTHVMERWLRSKGIRRPVRIVRPNVPYLKAGADAWRTVRQKHRAAENEVIAFCASRLSYEKDIDLLLHALSLVPPSVALKVWIAGGGPEEANLRKLARELRLGHRLVWLGEVPHQQIADYYAATDFFVLPSRNDTLGMVVLEAMAMGKPCVVMNQNGPAEIVRHKIDGYQCLDDPAALAGAIALMAQDADRRKLMGSNAREGCRQFCTPNTASGLMEAYEVAIDVCRLDRILGKTKPRTRTRRRTTGAHLS